MAGCHLLHSLIIYVACEERAWPKLYTTNYKNVYYVWICLMIIKLKILPGMSNYTTLQTDTLNIWKYMANFKIFCKKNGEKIEIIEKMWAFPLSVWMIWEKGIYCTKFMIILLYWPAKPSPFDDHKWRYTCSTDTTSKGSSACGLWPSPAHHDFDTGRI